MALPPSTANWHWKNKNVTKWGKEWFERELTTVIVSGDGDETVGISHVFEVDGDMELGQRKSKLITIYDCKLVLDWKGTASDGTQVSGRLKIPEVSHENTLDGTSEYQYMWELDTTESPAVTSLYALAKSKIPPLLEEKFKRLPIDLIETHGKDLTVSADPSRSGTPAPASSTGVTIPATGVVGGTSTPPVVAVKPKAKPTNTSVVTAEATFMATADDLFSILTDQNRIPSWSRAAAISEAKPNTAYSLFGGGVKGIYISLTPGKEIKQSWVLSSPSWPVDHRATLTTTFSQSTDSTNVKFTLEGVPTGMEDEIKKNVEGYYIHGLKSIGLGSVL